MNKAGLALSAMVALLPLSAAAFDSGSTGADGAFNPTVNTEVTLPESGILNFTTVNIPSGVTVTFKRNARNTPVVMLASGDVVIAGTLSVVGKAAAAVGTFGDGVQGDDGLPGAGGPGGFDGGRGGKIGPAATDTVTVLKTAGGAGLGPGGGGAGSFATNSGWGSVGFPMGGGGASFGSLGVANYPLRTYPTYSWNGYGLPKPGAPGATYGAAQLLPLIGGSGGGGAAGGVTYMGGGGGGGGGALLVASTGTVTISGAVLATGGKGGDTYGAGLGGAGGSGSGGAIRLIATKIAGAGKLNADGGAEAGYSPDGKYNGGAGGAGRIRLEADAITYSGAVSPTYSKDVPGPIYIASAPSLRIASVAGTSAPANPTGNADIVLPDTLQNPVTVTFETTNVPVGNTVVLTVSPAYGAATQVQSAAISGTTASGTASVQVTLAKGASILSATTTYTIVASAGDALASLTNNERVAQVTLLASLGGETRARLTTISGKQFDVPASALAVLAG